jgi:hypothetical protein
MAKKPGNTFKARHSVAKRAKHRRGKGSTGRKSQAWRAYTSGGRDPVPF